MAESNSISLSANAIIDILTLRYNTENNPALSKLTWNDFTPTNFETSIEFIQKSIKKTLQNSIKTNCEKISIALSGGIDSALNLALLRDTFPNLQISAISLKFADSIDETPQAAKIAEHFGAEHEIIHLDNFFIELPQAISITKQPFWDLHWYYIVKKAKSHSDSLVSGDGGDELFGGYTFRYKKFLSLIDTNSTPLEKIKAYLLCHERDHVPDQEEVFGKKARFSWKYIYKTLISYFDNKLSPIEQVFLADYNGKLLYNFSPLNERISNHFDIESISPLLSEEILTYSLSIPMENKYDKIKNIGKLPLRKLLSKYNMDKFIPHEKLGFNVNTLNLWKSVGKSLCQEYLVDSQAAKDGWINKDWINRYVRQDDLDVRYVNKFLGLLAFEVWYRLFITKEMSANTTLN